MKVNPLLPDSVEKLQNRKCWIFRYQSKILKTNSKSIFADSQAAQKHRVRELASPSAKISYTFSKGLDR